MNSGKAFGSAPSTERSDARWPFSSLRDCEPIRSFARIVCYRVEGCRGDGTEANPFRITTSWFTADGDLIAYEDSWADARARGAQAKPSTAAEDQLAGRGA